jgi:hypothetical protein
MVFFITDCIQPKQMRQHPIRPPLTEDRCTAYLCPLSANTYGIEFLEFRIREMEGQQRELYHVKKPDDVVRFLVLY